MPKKLKTYQTSLGFYDQAIAAPSMKAALAAWGASSNLFHQGVAKETDDPDIVAATMAKPGVVLRRPVGSDGPFTESAELPADLGEGETRPRRKSKIKSGSQKRPAKAARTASRAIDDAAARKAAAAFEKEERRREAERAKEEAARARERARRDKAVTAAEAALDKARREHDAKAEAIEAERAALDARAEAEQERWDKQRKKLGEALRRARE
ncbi:MULTISPECIES: cell envelope biogenesis protein TolA [Bradyrhizobium]|uniref:cell envelope biogenesis protein TolA n=1 Tax=Bradyrhizobium TaxID=374 RepID=UPI00155E04E3|nr:MULTISPECIES: cell envelope biogenesis protein TolA [Bradyrhizobium]MDD1520796.1 cell envelope biogenesis protein TolA [Bradyrhizobium sp. WBAH30]MDD1546547.1 cell envelope biogenesis protein TolA [Bradyrhizobium sp. WBAH41]MDD1560241.1 cell envelope biogenesis protein TolA [Bradyrhizobium sp. WBAH23]MDD1568836.1 cell envelope biogenesis protein TolA [Bradyrhizobium sp. WBAH33]MDD1592379.1 cell envelope biogenesis protein TolA [Bradyrhizobium sp. WBAH42]